MLGRLSHERLKKVLLIIQIVGGAASVIGALVGGFVFLFGNPFEGRVPIDPSVRDLRQLADGGNAQSQHELGFLYFNGDKGLDKDLSLAFKYIKSAAEQGHVPSQSALGWFYDAGFGTPRDLAAALRWNEKAADAGNAPAQNALAWYHINGTHGFEQDVQAGISLFMLSCEGGFDLACLTLGDMYLRGSGVDRDCGEALRWIGLAIRYDGPEVEKARIALEGARASCG